MFEKFKCYVTHWGGEGGKGLNKGQGSKNIRKMSCIIEMAIQTCNNEFSAAMSVR